MPLTCSAFALALAAAKGGEALILRRAEDCPTITISRRFSRPVQIVATGAQIRGLVITGGNIVWRGGTFRAAQGREAKGPPGYGIFLRGSGPVRLEGITVTEARKGLVLDGAAGTLVADSQFVRLGEDGIIAARSRNLTVVRNTFREPYGKPTRCQIGAQTLLGLPQRRCIGVWSDGFHPDAIQLRDGMTDVVIANNVVNGRTQGIAQMDTTGDQPLVRVSIRQNTVETDGRHHITLGANCIQCTITGNVVRRAAGSAMKAVINAGAAHACGNRVQDARAPEPTC